MKDKTAARDVALMGMLFALALVLSYLEGLIPPLLPVPGLKPGLSNIVVMCCVFFLGAKKAWGLAVLKALFVLLVQGPVGAALSLAGGLLSVGAMLLLNRGKRKRPYALVSMAGGVAHNAGQLAAAAALLGLVREMAVYAVFLIPAGIVMGVLTALLLRALLPLLQKTGILHRE